MYLIFNDIFFLISGIGMDSSITPLRHGGLSLVQTTDFFYPLVEDPYMQGVVSKFLSFFRSCIPFFYSKFGTLDYQINVGLRLLIFELFSQGYVLIR